MKIGIVCYPTYGGSGVLATELGLALANKGHEVHFITYKKPARLINFHKNVFFHEVNLMNYPLFEYQPYESSLASKMIDVAKFVKLDILHVHYAIPHASVAYLAKKILEEEGIQIPVVTTLHGTDITLVGIDPSFAPVVQFSINKSDCVTAVSNSLKKDTESSFNITKDIEVIYNFIDLKRFKRVEHKTFKKLVAPNGEKVILHTSNFRKVKRAEDVILAFKKINEQVSSKLLMIGDGPERQNLEQLCRQLGICNSIQFLGKQDAVEEILSVGDLFILPSEHESFGLSALEAMACGVPVISTDVGGLPEVNTDGVTGYLCKVGEVEKIAEKAIELLKDNAKLEKFKKNALARAQDFSKETIIPQYEKLYQNLIKRPELMAQ